LKDVEWSSKAYGSIDHKLLEDLFNGLKYKELKYPSIVQDAIDILDSSVPFRMKLFIAINETALLVSNLNKPIRLNSKTLVTTNVQNIMFAPSGASKDSTINKIRSNFTEAYNIILKRMIEIGIVKAKEKCVQERGNDKDWKEFYKGNTRTLFPAISTDEGMMNQMAILNGIGTGAYNMVGISELGSELKANPSLMTNLKVMAMGYDLGNVASKIVKTDELQTNDIKGLNMNLLMFSSMHTLLQDRVVKSRFVDYMTIQGARRTMICVNNTLEQITVHGNLLDIVNTSAKDDSRFESSGENLRKKSIKIIKALSIDSTAVNLPIATGNLENLENINARELYSLYKVFNEYRSNNVPNKFKMYAISTKHLHWKALKLAGIFAMLEGVMVIETKHMLQAISIVEYFNEDLIEFQVEIDKEIYELIADYCDEMAIDGSLKVTKHTLIKNGFIANNTSEVKLKELIDLMNLSYENGVFTYVRGNISYKRIKAKEEVTVVTSTEITPIPVDTQPIKSSPKIVENKVEKDENLVLFSLKQYKDSNGNPCTFESNKASKEHRNKAEPINWRNGKSSFSSIIKLMGSNTISFSPYRFGDGMFKEAKVSGYRSLESIIDPSNMIVLDVDKTVVSMDDMHELLQQYQHIIGTTSDPENYYKYRVVLRLDREVELAPREWRVFYKSIADMLGIEVDTIINKASMFHGYDGCRILENTTGELISTKKHIVNAHMVESLPEIVPVTTEKQFQRSWDERFDTFEYAYDCNRHRSIVLYGAMRTACKMGWKYEAVKELMVEINETIERPLEEKRFNRTIIGQIKKFLIKKG